MIPFPYFLLVIISPRSFGLSLEEALPDNCRFGAKLLPPLKASQEFVMPFFFVIFTSFFR